MRIGVGKFVGMWGGMGRCGKVYWVSVEGMGKCVGVWGR